jgi:hypothetical protein
MAEKIILVAKRESVERKMSAEKIAAPSDKSVEEETIEQQTVKKEELVVDFSQLDEAAQFLEPIKPQVVREGENAMFTAFVTGVPQPEVTWFKDNAPLEAGPKYELATHVDSGTATLTVKNTTEEDFGNFTCQAQNAAGRAKSTANLVVVRKYHATKLYINKYSNLNLPLCR